MTGPEPVNCLFDEYDNNEATNKYCYWWILTGFYVPGKLLEQHGTLCILARATNLSNLFC